MMRLLVAVDPEQRNAVLALVPKGCFEVMVATDAFEFYPAVADETPLVAAIVSFAQDLVSELLLVHEILEKHKGCGVIALCSPKTLDDAKSAGATMVVDLKSPYWHDSVIRHLQAIQNQQAHYAAMEVGCYWYGHYRLTILEMTVASPDGPQKKRFFRIHDESGEAISHLEFSKDDLDALSDMLEQCRQS